MAKHRSEWYARAIAVIDEALMDIDVAEGRAAVKHALRTHYPFGQREHHPYKMWCKAVKHTLDRLLPKEGQPKDPVVRIHPAIGVVCGWCHGKECFACLAARQRFRDLWTTREADMKRWSAWDREAATNESERLIMADFVEVELGLEEEAGHLRKCGVVRKPKRRKV